MEYDGGRFTANGSSLTTKELALQAWTAHNLPDGMEPGLEATYVFDPENFSWPAGTHIAVVEVDTETGAVDLIGPNSLRIPMTTRFSTSRPTGSTT